MHSSPSSFRRFLAAFLLAVTAACTLAPSARALTAASLAAANLPGKTLRFTITGGNAPFETGGLFTVVFGTNGTYTMPIADGNAAFRSGTYSVRTDSVGTVIRFDGYILNNATVEALIIPTNDDQRSQFEMYTTGANKRGTVVFDTGVTGAPAITSATTATATVGTPFTYTITTNPAATSFANSGGSAPVSINPATGVVSGTFNAAGTFTFSFTANNASGSSAVTTVTVTVTAGGTSSVAAYAGSYTGSLYVSNNGGPETVFSAFTGTISTTGTLVAQGGEVTGTVNASGVVTFNSNGLSMTTGTITNDRLAAQGGPNVLGGVTRLFRIDATRAGATTAPAITAQPSAQTISLGGSVTFTVTVSGTGLTYQWFFNGNAIAGATNLAYTIAQVLASHAGNYSVRITGPGGTTTSNAAVLTVGPAGTAGAYLSNLSVRARAGSGSETLIVGVTVGGGTGGTKNVLIRGVGPTLGVFGVANVLADPVLSVYSGNTLVTSNDDWGNDPAISATSVAVGAFALPASSRDAAINGAGVTAGGYTVQLTGKAGATGTGLIELYDTAPAASLTSTTHRFTNLSARTFGGTGSDTLIVGFNVVGTGTRRLVLRAVGPGLAAFGLGGTMADPKLELYSGTAKISENDNWDATTLAAQQSVGAFALTSGSRDAVLVTTLAPGAYTVQVAGGTTGVALVEVYEAP